MKVLLIYPPFCTPASPPYSLVNLRAFLDANSEMVTTLLDLNLEFHQLKFSKYQDYFQSFTRDYSKEKYEQISKEYHQITKTTYSENNKKVVNNQDPELLKELTEQIKDQNTDLVAFSIVYSSQAFYSLALIKELKKQGIKTVVGGPAVNDKIIAQATKYCQNEVELLEYLTEKKVNHQELVCDNILDFNICNLKDYFVSRSVIPIKTTSTCFYKRCTFCTHHQNKEYYEFPLEQIKETIINSKQKQFFFIDDMISKKRLLQLAEMLKPLNISWMCQLRPTKDLDYETLKTLSESGLKSVIWGVESGCNRILNLMQKGTNKEDVAKVLADSKKAKIKNVLYIMFGFPTETKEEFMETINFLKDNTENIALVSTSTFGLQKGTPIFNNPSQFGVTEITETKRTVLEPKISYQTNSGLTPKEIKQLKKNHQKTLEKINKFPKEMNFFREHLLNLN
jgi:tRNA A37 methylthiotransferase MiaB